MKEFFQKAPKKSKNQVIDGVCAGIANELDINPFWVRLAAVISIPITGGFTVLVYIFLIFIMEEES